VRTKDAVISLTLARRTPEFSGTRFATRIEEEGIVLCNRPSLMNARAAAMR
jgi:hypothetical protein